MHIINYYRSANQNHNEYHYTLTRTAEMKETDWQECAAAILSYIAGESVVVQPLWKTVCQFLIKLNIFLTYDPAILNVNCERFENIYLHKHIHEYS